MQVLLRQDVVPDRDVMDQNSRHERKADGEPRDDDGDPGPGPGEPSCPRDGAGSVRRDGTMFEDRLQVAREGAGVAAIALLFSGGLQDDLEFRRQSRAQTADLRRRPAKDRPIALPIRGRQASGRTPVTPATPCPAVNRPYADRSWPNDQAPNDSGDSALPTEMPRRSHRNHLFLMNLRTHKFTERARPPSDLARISGSFGRSVASSGGWISTPASSRFAIRSPALS